MQLASGIQPAQALWLLSLFGALYRRPVDSALLARECVPPLRPDDVQRIGALIGLDAILEQWNLSLERAPLLQNALPLAIEIADKEVAGTDMPGNCEWFVLLQVEESRVVVAQRGLSEPQTLELAALWPRLTGRMLKVRPQALAAEDPEAVHDARGHFGFRWFLPELLKHRVLWQEVLVASVVLQLLALGLPLFTQTIIDKVIVHRTQSTLIALSMGMVVFLVFTAILTWVRQYLILHTGRRVDAVLGSHVFEHLFRLPLRYFHHRPTGVVAARMQGVETIREFISSAAVTLMLELPFLAVFVAIMFWYSVQLTLIVLAILAVIVAASLLVAPLFQSRLNEQFLRGAGIQAFLTEYVSGMETVKSLQLEPQLNRRYRDLLAVFLDSSFRTRQLANAYGTFASTLEQIMSLTVLALGAWIVMEGPSPQPSPETGRVGEALTIGMLVAFQMFASRVSQPMLRLVGLWQQFQQARLAVQRLGDIMNVPTEPYRLARTRTGARAGAVSIEEVSFRYDDNLPLLFDAFSLAVAPGQLIAIMGPSGAGKSTLARLLQGFCVPTAGVIRIDGVDIRCLAANELRSHFGVVPQETTLFSGTILENLQLAAPFASFEQVTAACKMAEIASAIEALPNGYQTQLGERGVGLSGGQRQRLAIARALLKGPRILIFDEATASLDPATAEQLARTINAFKQRTTILFIAHALPKSLQVDRVVRVGEKLMMVQGEAAGGVGPGPDKESPSSIVAEGSAPSPGLGRGLG